MLPMLLLLAGFAINIAYMQLASTEIRIATDAAARAAGRVYSTTGDEANALNMANKAGMLNPVAGESLMFELSDLDFGESTRADANSRYEFKSGGAINAVQISGRRTSDSMSGSIGTFFPNLMGSSDFEISARSVSTQMEVDLALVLDRSGSMAYADEEEAVYPPIPSAAPLGWDFGDPAPKNARWRNVVAATKGLLNELDKSPLHESIALVSYADKGSIDQPLTSNYATILDALNERTVSFKGGGTNIAGGLSAGQSTLTANDSRQYAAKVTLILTDGRSTVGPNPVTLAKSMADKGVLVICVTFSKEADQDLMLKVAEAGNGFHRHAETKEDLLAVFTEISSQLPTLLTK